MSFSSLLGFSGSYRCFCLKKLCRTIWFPSFTDTKKHPVLIFERIFGLSWSLDHWDRVSNLRLDAIFQLHVLLFSNLVKEYAHSLIIINFTGNL